MRTRTFSWPVAPAWPRLPPPSARPLPIPSTAAAETVETQSQPFGRSDNWRSRRSVSWWVGLAVALVLLAGSATPQALASIPSLAGGNGVVTTIPVGNSPFGVAANTLTGWVYVANASAASASVINASNNTVVATIPVGPKLVAVAVKPLTGRIYVADLGADSVSVINGATNTITATTPLGSDPNEVAINPSNFQN